MKKIGEIVLEISISLIVVGIFWFSGFMAGRSSNSGWIQKSEVAGVFKDVIAEDTLKEERGSVGRVVELPNGWKLSKRIYEQTKREEGNTPEVLDDFGKGMPQLCTCTAMYCTSEPCNTCSCSDGKTYKSW